MSNIQSQRYKNQALVISYMKYGYVLECESVNYVVKFDCQCTL